MKIIKLFLIINLFSLPLFATNDDLNTLLRVKAAIEAGRIDEEKRLDVSTSKSPVGGRRRWIVIKLKEDKKDEKIDDSRSEDSE